MSSIKSVNSSDESSKKSSIKIHEQLYIRKRAIFVEKSKKKDEDAIKEEKFNKMR